MTATPVASVSFTTYRLQSIIIVRLNTTARREMNTFSRQGTQTFSEYIHYNIIACVQTAYDLFIKTNDKRKCCTVIANTVNQKSRKQNINFGV